MGKVVDSSKDKMYVGQFQESGHVVSDKGQSFSEGSGRTWFGWGKKKERKAGPRGRALEAVEQKQEESSDEDEPLEHACDALLVGGALRGGGSLAADGAFGTLTADGTSRPVYHSLKSNARTDAKVLKLCAPPLNAGMVLTCGQTRGVSAFRWKDYEVTTTKESSKWWKKAKATTSRKRCWERSGDLKGARDWGLCLASDARGSYAVAGCRGGDLKLWRPPKAEQSGINRWVEAGVAERSHASSRMRSDVRAVAVDDNSDTLVSGGTDWCVRLWDARTLRSKGALGDINRADNPDADENYDDDARGHNYPVTTVDIRQNIIVSGGEDKRVMLWDRRSTEGAVACLNRMAPVTVVKFVGKDHELLVAGEYGIAEIIDLRTHTSVTTLMKPSEFDAKTKEVEGVWEGQLKNQHPILDACVSPTGDRVSILAWRPAGGVVEVFDSDSWSLVSQVDLATELPRISPSSLAACRLPAGGC
jgi:WD40 repeat protein